MRIKFYIDYFIHKKNIACELRMPILVFKNYNK
jgi:hypothetical protein